MKNKFASLFRRENRIQLITIIGLFILFASAIIFPYYQEYIDQNWDSYINKKIEKTIQEIQDYFNIQQSELVHFYEELSPSVISHLRKSRIEQSKFQQEFVQITTSKERNGISFHIYDNNFHPLAWSNYRLSKSPDFMFDEEHSFQIIKTNFKTYLALIHKIYIDSALYYFVLSKTIESNYLINNEFIQNTSLEDFFYDRYDFKIKIIWDTLYFSLKPEALEIKFPTFYPITFINKRTSFYVYIITPEKEIYLKELSGSFGKFQKIVFLFVITVIIYSLYRDLRSVETRFLQALAFTLIIWFYRAILLFLDFPAFLINGEITNPSIYASRFLGGLVKSPLELFLTSTALSINLIIFFILYRIHFLESKVHEKLLNPKSKYLSIFISIIFLILTPFVLRGFGASFRSFVFDSTIKLFAQPYLIPDLTYLFMYYSVFVTGIALVIYLILVIYVLLKLLKHLLTEPKIYQEIIFTTLALTIPIALFFFIDRNPQYDLLTIFLVILTCVLITISSIREYAILTFRTIFLLLITASFFSTIFIFQKNLEQEREFQKTIAHELIKTRDQLINFAINQTLQQISSDEEFSKLFFLESSSSFTSYDFDHIAYKLWINSILSDEGLNSYLILFDKYGKKIGSFGFGMIEPEYIQDYFSTRLVSSLTIFLITTTSPNVLMGIIPIRFNNNLIGYCGVVIELSRENFHPSTNNTLFKNIKYEKNPFKLIPDAVVYTYQNNLLVLLKGENLPEYRELSPELIEKVIDRENSEFWVDEAIDNKKFKSFYYIYNVNEPIKLICVSIPGKNPISVIFNIFKITLVHLVISSIILLGGTILLLAKGYNFRFRFKTKLFIGLFIVTLIPIILLAYFTRESEIRRWKENLSNELKKDLDFVSLNLKRNENIALNELKHINQDLNIEYNLFKNDSLIYSSQHKLYEIGFFPQSLPVKIYLDLTIGYKNYAFEFEYISKFPYLVGYKKISTKEGDYIISIPTIYQQEKIQKELAQIDTFIFGAYSLTILLIFLFGNLFFERLTKPISELTEATRKVSSGDLSIKLEPKETGEVGDLIEAFNKMISDLDESRKKLARAEREQAWREMAKQVAHEIKNPLTPMKLSLQHLQFLYKENRKEFSRIFGKVSTSLIQQVEALTKITNEFSHFARMPERTIVKCNLEEILKEVITLFSAQAEITFEHIKTEKFIVNADKEELKRIFINLVKNSIQANSTKITIKLYSDVNYCFVNIEDNGTGIPAEILDKIFDPNFSTKTEGTGLGLPIVKRILDDLNGTIEIKSEVGRGTIVMIAIPKIKDENYEHFKSPTASGT